MEQETTLIQQLRRTLGRMEAAMAAIHDALAITDDRGRLIWCNDPFLQLCGITRLRGLGQPIQAVLPRSVDSQPLIPGDWSEAIAEQSGSKVSVLRQQPLQVVEIQWDPILGDDPAGMVFCVRDISTLISYQELWARSESIQQRSREIETLNARLRRSQQHLAMQVRECPVTGLPNRRGLMEHLERALARTTADGAAFAVLFCDLNHFKEVNDNHGHDAGDDLLIEISRRLRQATRRGDLVARLGGDEFVVVSHNLKQSIQAREIADRLQQAVGQPWTIGAEILHPSLSIGIAIAGDASCNGHSQTIDQSNGQSHGLGSTAADSQAALSAQELIRRADQAMYAAKGANLLSGQLYDDELAQQQEQSSRILQLLRTAIARRSLALHVQPIVELGSGAVCGHEALVRLPGADGELLSPDRFIPQAERSRQIGELGRQVLEQALQWLRSNDASGEALSIAVNVSPLELAEAGFAGRVLEACAGAGIHPRRLHLEITETAIISQPANAAEVLSQLRRAGVRIHLDDFGTGYSSLSLLSELPVDGIKIDRSFTASLGEDRSRTAVIQAITQLCRELGISVIAEGIETEAQQQRLIGLRCDFGQGYLFGRPAPLDGGRRDPR